MRRVEAPRARRSGQAVPTGGRGENRKGRAKWFLTRPVAGEPGTSWGRVGSPVQDFTPQPVGFDSRALQFLVYGLVRAA